MEEIIYYTYKEIRYNTLEEVEKIIQEEMYEDIKFIIMFWIKFWIYLFLIFQIIDNFVKYMESRSNQSLYIEFEEDF